MLSTINRLIFTISTGYPYPNNPMKEQINYGKKVLDGVVEDDKFFLMCYELDEEDEWTDETKWIKSNPLQATSELGMDFLRSECKMALELPSKQLSFRTKNLNQWLDGDESETYIPMEKVKECKIDNYNWRGKEVYLGLDLSLTTDNTAVSMITYDKELKKFVGKSWAFIPTERAFNKSKTEKVDYFMHKEKGNCFFCGDEVIDYSFIEDFILDLENKYGVKIMDIGYDRYNCVATANRLYREGLEVTEIRQHSSVLHPATKFLKECILNKMFVYEDNQLLEINFANARETKDTNLNGYVNKKKSNGRIDMLVAMINAMTFWEKEFAGQVSVYETDERREGFLML